MKLEISENILKNTTKCNKDFACLSGERECLCKLEDSIIDTPCFIIIRAENCGFCDYNVSFGNFFICTCPTRNEIYKCYEI